MRKAGSRSVERMPWRRAKQPATRRSRSFSAHELVMIRDHTQNLSSPSSLHL